MAPQDGKSAQLNGQQHLELLLDSALNASDSHFMITDLAGTIVYANRALASSHGFEPVQLIGRPARALMPRELNAAQLAQIREASQQGRPLRVEVRGRNGAGATIWIGVKIEPVFDRDGRVTHFVSIGSDITRNKEDARIKEELRHKLGEERAERERMTIELHLAQKLESVGRLAAGVAHEINTPIQYVGDHTTFLQSAIPDMFRLIDAHADGADAAEEVARQIDLDFLRAEMPKAVERSLEGVDRVAAIVRAMKEFAHPGAVAQANADINHALETALTMTRGEYKYVASVETHLGDLPPVRCNIGELNQVFLNLIVNAAHALEAAGRGPETGRIRVSTEAQGDTVLIRIGDNGCGIAAEHLDKIFDPFFTTKEVGKGTGQGLAITHTIIVKKHCGRVEVASVPGEGTTFTLALPVAGTSAAEELVAEVAQ